MTYSKKQMKPLIDKYQINPETNKLFKSIIEMFDNQPNYQFWALLRYTTGRLLIRQ